MRILCINKFYDTVNHKQYLPGDTIIYSNGIDINKLKQHGYIKIMFNYPECQMIAPINKAIRRKPRNKRKKNGVSSGKQVNKRAC